MKPTLPSPMVPVINMPVPVGYRFNPKDEELIGYYLLMLLSGFSSLDMPIGIVDFWELEPWELPAMSKIRSDDQVWYFFCKRVLHTDMKKRTFKRKTGAGRWKSTRNSTNIDGLGKRSTLRFYMDSPKVEMTEWKAYEYEITQNSTLSNPDEFVIIKLMNSAGEKKTKIKTQKRKRTSKGMTTSASDPNQTLDEQMRKKKSKGMTTSASDPNQTLDEQMRKKKSKGMTTSASDPNQTLDDQMRKKKSKGMTTSASDPNQTLDEVMTASGAEFGNQDVGNAPIVPSFSRFNQSSQMVSAGEMMNIDSGNGPEVAPSKSECQNRVDTSAMSSRDTGEPHSWATSRHQNHSSVTKVQDRGYLPMGASPRVPENQEEYEHSDCLFASDFENQKLPLEVEDNALKIPPRPDNQRAPEATDPSSSMTSRLEDNIQNEEFNQSSKKVDDLWSLIDFNVDEFLQCLLDPEMQETINGDIRMKSD